MLSKDFSKFNIKDLDIMYWFFFYVIAESERSGDEKFKKELANARAMLTMKQKHNETARNWQKVEVTIPTVLKQLINKVIINTIWETPIQIQEGSINSKILRGLIQFKYLLKASGKISDIKFKYAFPDYDKLIGLSRCETVVFNALHEIDPELIDDQIELQIAKIDPATKIKEQFISW